MLKQNVKYIDFDGNECEDTLYFNLTKQELTMMEISYPQGMSEYIKEVVKAGNNIELARLFKTLILDAYGIKSEDGKKFVKSHEIRHDFEMSQAFSEVFMGLLVDPDSMETFVKAVTNNA